MIPRCKLGPVNRSPKQRVPVAPQNRDLSSQKGEGPNIQRLIHFPIA